MRDAINTDESVVEKARRTVVEKSRLPKFTFILGIMFLGFSMAMTMVAVKKLDHLDASQLNMGFLYGITLAVLWTSFGLVGALCLGKVLVGFSNDYRAQELLVQYHDRLRELGQLPPAANAKPATN